MAYLSVPDIRIKGMSASVPAQREDNADLDLIPESQRQSFIDTTGIRYRHIAPKGLTAADLCYEAAVRLLPDIGWQAAEVDVLLFVTQTPDYIIPNSASIIQHRLGTSTGCIAFDINLGCSGYVYGLSVIASLLQNIPNGKGLLLVGDCSSSVTSKNDKSTYPLFSDAGSATAVEQVAGAGRWHFDLQTNGAGYEDIIVRDGGMRNPMTAASLTEKQYNPGEARNSLQMKLDGINIFNFALREVAPNIERLLSLSGRSKDTTDFFVLHQANKLILECVRKKLKEVPEKFPYSLYHYGNTSSASIPMTIVTEIRDQINGLSKNLILSGFGVGLSWGSACIPFHEAVIQKLIEI